ncbi:MAG TPA: L,D-transpeptidase [Candidatus Tumulicola sp.]|jgi:lipoprotein-anchoring transpeptidase ErfK/SrfK|nr:L,D-transpeptidase [Candidatus Tumulicola sp.]HSC32010.1 L,D-transpeptidase [Gemmatimonadaceae bacterium]
MNPFRSIPRGAYVLGGIALAVVAASGVLLYSTLQVRYRRDISRIVFNRNWDLLDQVRRDAGVTADSLRRAMAEASPGPDADKPYIVVSISDRRLWYKLGDSVFYTTRVAVGSGKTLVKQDGRDEYKFDTPRGRLTVQSKDVGPVWVPPDWHFLEIAEKRKLGVVMLKRGQKVPAADGAVITVDGNDVVKKYPDGHEVPYESGEGREIVDGKNIIVPPYGTNQRKYRGTLGGHRLDLGDGYALHGTDEPKSVGEATSHGCVRLRNEDIDYLYGIVPVGTPVYIY